MIIRADDDAPRRYRRIEPTPKPWADAGLISWLFAQLSIVLGGATLIRVGFQVAQVELCVAWWDLGGCCMISAAASIALRRD